MMRRAAVFLIVITTLFSGLFSCDTQRNTEDPDLQYFVKYYGGDGNQRGVDMISLNDGSFLLLGNSEGNSQTDISDIYVARVNAEGDIIWERKFFADISMAKDIESTNDGNFIILADYQTAIGSQMEGKLIKISPDGIMLDSVFFGEIANDYSKSVTALNDGGFIVSGTTELTGTWADSGNPDPDLGDFFNRRFDLNLDELVTLGEWSPVSPGFGGKLDVAVKTIQKPGEFYVFGYSNTESRNNPNNKLGLTYFKRTDVGTGGNIFYPDNALGEDNKDVEIYFVEPVSPALGDGFIIIGSSRDNFGVSDIFIARMRENLVFGENDPTFFGPLRLSRDIRGVSATSSLRGTVGFILLGDEVRSTGARNIWLTKIDQSRTVVWSSTFGSESEDDSGAAVAELPDGKILILGTMGLADNQYKMALIKMNPQGQLLK